jgi:flagellin
MALSVNYNASAVRSSLALAQADRLLGQSIQRLSTGVRIERSADDPAGLTLANQMRHHLQGLTQAADNMEDGVNLLQTADSAAGEISDLLIRLRGLAVSAGNLAPSDSDRLGAVQGDFDALVGALDRIAADASFGGLKLLTGGLADNRIDRTVRDPQGLTAHDHLTAVRHDLRRLPDGVADGTAISVAAPDSPLASERVQVGLRTAANTIPSANTAINNLRQLSRTGNSVTTTALTVNGGEGVTISGARGSERIVLQPGTTIQQFIDQVNARQELTGVTARYDATAGNLELEGEHWGFGLLTVRSDDLTGGGNVGLLDPTTSAATNPLAVAGSVWRMQLDDRATSAAATASTRLDDLIEPGGALLADAASKAITVYGDGTAIQFVPSGPTWDDALAMVQEHAARLNASVTWNAGSGVLTVVDDPGGAATTTTLNVTDTNRVDDLLAFIDTGITDADLAWNAGARRLDISRDGQIEDTLTLGTASVQDFLNFMATNGETVGARAELDAAGNLTVTGTRGPVVVATADSTLRLRGRGLLDLDTSNLEADGGVRVNKPIFDMAFSLPDGSAAPASTLVHGSQANGVLLDDAAGRSVTLNDGTNSLVINITATTTLQQVVDAVNGSNLLARAEFSNGRLRLLGNSTTLTVSSQDMSADSAKAVGLWDENTAAADNGRATVRTDPTAELSYTAVDGSERRVVLHQSPSADGGLSFRNLTGGPLAVDQDDLADGIAAPRFAGWEPDAWRVTVRDRSTSSGPRTIDLFRQELVATRSSRHGIQTGARGGESVNLDIPDLRAEALGGSAGLAGKGLGSLQDLVRTAALSSGRIEDALAVIDAASARINSVRGDIGSLQGQSVERALAYVRVNTENLTAAESRVRDTDMALESAELSKQQIRFQAATSMLAQANQLPQSVLRLLDGG